MGKNKKGGKSKRNRNKQKQAKTDQKAVGGPQLKDSAVSDAARAMMESYTGEASNLQEQSRKLFDSIFQSMLGGTKSRKLTKEEIQAENEETMLLIAEVNDNIEKVKDTCEKIKKVDLAAIEGLDMLKDDDDGDFSFKGIVLTKKQEDNLMKRNKNYQQLDAQEKTLLKEKEDLLGLLESVRLIDEGSVCLQVEEELLVVVERELQKTREFKELVAVQEMPELLATNLNEARSEKSDVVEIKEN